MKLAPTLVFLLAAAVLGGCGDSDGGDSALKTGPAPRAEGAPPGAEAAACPKRVGSATEIRATGLNCRGAAAVIGAWTHRHCLPAGGGSRAGCTVMPFRCTAVASGRGYSVSCAAQGRSIAFTVPRQLRP
jgi:hypothetical protein